MKLKTHDALFVVQLVCAVVFVSAQSMRMSQTMQGISPTWMVCAEAFCAVGVALAWRGWRMQPSRPTLQLLLAHCAWTIGIGWLTALTAWKIGEIDWGWYDVGTFVLVIVAVALTLVVSRQRGLDVADPITRGTLGAIFRCIPHLTLACKIALLGGAGLAGMTVFAAHTSALTRIGQLAFAIREAGWNRGRRGLAIAEVASEGSWILVTIAWYFQ